MANSKCFRVNENLISGPTYYKFKSSMSSELQQHFQRLRQIGVLSFLDDFETFTDSLSIKRLKKSKRYSKNSTEEENPYRDLISLGRLSSLFVISSFLIAFSVIVLVAEQFTNSSRNSQSYFNRDLKLCIRKFVCFLKS